MFRATAKSTDPDPVRPVPFGNDKKLLVLDALQVQPYCVVTAIMPALGAAGALVFAGLIE